MNKINTFKTNTQRKIRTISNAFFNKQLETATNNTLKFFSNALKENFYPTLDIGTNRQIYTTISNSVKIVSTFAKNSATKTEI